MNSASRPFSPAPPYSCLHPAQERIVGFDTLRCSLSSCWLLVTMLFATIVPAAQSASYLPGFVWRRAADWWVQPTDDAGTTRGNPAPDALGNKVWNYEYFCGGGPLDSTNAWYGRTLRRLVWDSDWYQNGFP